MLLHWQWFFAQIWLGTPSGDCQGIIIWHWGLALNSVEVIGNRKCWKSNSEQAHNPGKRCKCCKPLLWTMKVTQSWTRSSAGVTGIAPPNPAMVYLCEHSPKISHFGSLLWNLDEGYLLPLGTPAVNSTSVKDGDSRLLGSQIWNQRQRCDPKEGTSFHVRMTFSSVWAKKRGEKKKKSKRKDEGERWKKTVKMEGTDGEQIQRQGGDENKK